MLFFNRRERKEKKRGIFRNYRGLLEFIDIFQQTESRLTFIGKKHLKFRIFSDLYKYKKALFCLATILLILLVQQPKIILAVDNNNIEVLEREAESFYQQSNYSEAEKSLIEAISKYQKKGESANTAIALRNLALVYQKLGQWQQATDTLERAETIIITLKNQAEKDLLLAQILEVRGQIELSLGRSQLALETWNRSISLYERQDNIAGYTQAKIYRASALQALGLYSQAIKTLIGIKEQLKEEPDTPIKAQALLNIGNVLTRIGKYEQAETILKSSLIIAEKIPEKFPRSEFFLTLGHNARLQLKPQKALKYYQQAKDISNNYQIQLRVKIARLDILSELEEKPDTSEEVRDIQQLLTQLPIEQTTIQARVSLARNLLKIKTDPNRVIPILIKAIQQAKTLKIARIEAEALGVLGNLYEQNQKWLEAEKITDRALLISQNINAKELTYQWQWQLGRILKAQNKNQRAISNYTQAVNNLQFLRSDLIAISSDIQYSFQEKIEPVYRELAALLLKSGASQKDLERARQIIELLQVAELDNFFRDACLDTEPVQIEKIDPTAAIFYTIIIENRLDVIVAIPNRPLQHYSNNLPPSEIEIAIDSANSQISNPRRLNLQLLQQVYDWLIRPVEANLQTNKIKTLVFVPDGILRNLPPATLHDGKQYAIEKYNIAIAPSLQLTQLQAREIQRQEILLAGLSEPRQGFTSLPGVKQEIQEIEPLFASKVLLNRNFTEFNFNRSAEETPFRIVHLATHGQFSSQAEDTFVLTWDERINIDELNNLIRGDSQQLHPVDLLVLSACETATGDRNSALGLAGIAVRGGARSTLASLWTVNDRATTELMTHFYQELAKGDTTKAEALRRAQISILHSERFSHPFFWSAFILVGNWQ